MRTADARRVAAAVALNQLSDELRPEELKQVAFTVDQEGGISAADALAAYEQALDDARRAFHPEGKILGGVARVLDFTPHTIHRAVGVLKKPLVLGAKLVMNAAAAAITKVRTPKDSDAALASASAVAPERPGRRARQVAKDVALLPIRTVKGVLTWRPEDVKSKHVVEATLPSGEVRRMTVEVDDLALSIWLLRSSANACAVGGVPLPGTGAVSFLAAAIASGALGVHRLRQGDLQGAKACALTTAKVATLSLAIAGPIVAAYQQSHDLIHAAHSGAAVGLAADGLILTMANSLGTRLDEIELGSDEEEEPEHPPLELGVCV